MAYYSTKLIKKIAAHLNHGGIIAYPTESCYGFGCDPFNYSAISKIIRIKGRSKKKGLIVIAAKLKQLDKLIEPLSKTQIKQVKTYWPGFYTLLLATHKKVPQNLIGQHHKIAVRVSKHHHVQQLCNTLNMPLISTSANKSGFKTIKTYRECSRQFGRQVMVLPGKTNFAKKPSPIIDLKTNQILRH